jgi:hypothetical protein
LDDSSSGERVKEEDGDPETVQLASPTVLSCSGTSRSMNQNDGWEASLAARQLEFAADHDAFATTVAIQDLLVCDREGLNRMEFDPRYLPGSD